MFYYTYVLESQADGNLYIGWTSDLRHRLVEHNKGNVEATSKRTPLILIYFEACLSKTLAIKREKQLKSGFGRKYLKSRLK